MEINFKRDYKWSGNAGDAPLEVRWSVTKWYERILVSPLVVYSTIAAGITTTGSVVGWVHLLLLPSYLLLYAVAKTSQVKWYEDKFLEAANKNPD